jgi:hypothetical protein
MATLPDEQLETPVTVTRNAKLVMSVEVRRGDGSNEPNIEVVVTREVPDPDGTMRRKSDRATQAQIEQLWANPKVRDVLTLIIANVPPPA